MLQSHYRKPFEGAPRKELANMTAMIIQLCAVLFLVFGYWYIIADLKEQFSR